MPQAKGKQALAAAQEALHQALTAIQKAEPSLHKAWSLARHPDLALWPTLEAVMAAKEAQPEMRKALTATDEALLELRRALAMLEAGEKG
jgi:hypothetical protein